MTTSNATSSEHQVKHQVKHQTTSNEHDVEKPLHSTPLKDSFDVDPSFDIIVGKATDTIAQKKASEQPQKQEKSGFYSPEQAGDMALKGLDSGINLLSKMNGFQIELPQETQMVFAALATPLVMKHGKTIENLLNPANVDLNSNIPEYLAVLAVGFVGVPTWLQIKEVKKLKAQLAKQQKNAPSPESKKAPEKKPPLKTVTKDLH